MVDNWKATCEIYALPPRAVAQVLRLCADETFCLHYRANNVGKFPNKEGIGGSGAIRTLAPQ